MVLRALQSIVGQILRRQVLDLHVRPGGTQQGGVVDDGQMAVLHQVYVQLRAEAALYRAAEGGDGVFGDAGLVMIAPVGIVPLFEIVPVAPPLLAAQGQQVQEKDHRDQGGQYDEPSHRETSFQSLSTSSTSSPTLAAGLLSPCLTNSMVTKASAVNTAA